MAKPNEKATMDTNFPISSRRDFLCRLGGGFGTVALGTALADDASGEVFKQNTLIDPLNPLASRQPHFPARAKNIIFLFAYGGPGSMDTFDYKPELLRLDGQPMPESIKNAPRPGHGGGVLRHCADKLMAGPWKWKQYGQSGTWISELFPHVAEHADKLCLVKSLYCDSGNHTPAQIQMNTGVPIGGKPSWGSWVTYGLGSENQNLPGFVLVFKGGFNGGAVNWTNAFLPAAFQGTQFRHQGAPVWYLQPPAHLDAVQRSTLDALQKYNQRHRATRAGLLDLEGRIASYELAYRMQAEALDVGDISNESQPTRELYGLDDPKKETAEYGRMCLMARRLVEKGVRVVAVNQNMGDTEWDAHDGLVAKHPKTARECDKANAGLLADLEQRGMLETTLVVWAGEFGRTPVVQGTLGRNHNPFGFTGWLAGGGVQGGQSIGATDAVGLAAEQDPHHIADFHATILAAMGIRNDELFFEHNGRPERLTGVAGSAKPIQGVFG